MAAKEKLTKSGKQALERQLDFLKNIELKKLHTEIDKGRKFCDFTEDVSFREMLETQTRLEDKIKSLENILNQAEIIADAAEKDVIAIGSRVTFIEPPNKTAETYTIVSQAEIEALASNEKISSASPIAKQLIGHRAGDQITVHTPGGEIILQIIKIE